MNAPHQPQSGHEPGAGADQLRGLAQHFPAAGAEATLRTILAVAPIGIGLIANRTFLWSNPHLSLMTGYEPEALWGQSARMLYETEEEFQRVGALKYAELRRTGTGTIETTWRRKDGQLIDVFLTTSDVRHEHKPRGMVFTALDISERKQAERRIRESEVRHRTLFQTSRDGIAFITLEGVFEDANPAFLEMVDYNLEDLRGRHIRELTPPRWVRDEEALLREIVQRTDTGSYQKELLRRDGTLVPVEVRAWVVRDEEGVPIRLMGVIRDISDRKRTENEHARLEAELRQAHKMEAVGQLAGGIAHDFNNILTAVLGNTELLTATLAKTIGIDKKTRDLFAAGLAQIEQASTRAADLTRQLLSFSRNQAVQRRLLDLNRLLADLEPMLGRLLGENIRLELQPADETPYILGDAAQMQQVLINLAVNARDAMPRGGTLSIKIELILFRAGRRRRPVDLRPGRYACIAVSDTGCGMAPDIVERIFEPFFTTKPVGRGTGLGLSTVYAIVQQAEGQITVDSRPGGGSTFQVYMPLMNAIAAEPGQPAAQAAPGGSETILVCEDESSVRTLTAQLLSRAGYHVLIAARADEALELAQPERQPLDLLLTDVVMPDQNGRWLAERLRERYPALRILYVSGYTSDVIADHGVLDEGVEFLAKPFNSRTLLQRVRDVLEGAPRTGGGPG